MAQYSVHPLRSVPSLLEVIQAEKSGNCVRPLEDGDGLCLRREVYAAERIRAARSCASDEVKSRNVPIRSPSPRLGKVTPPLAFLRNRDGLFLQVNMQTQPVAFLLSELGGLVIAINDNNAA